MSKLFSQQLFPGSQFHHQDQSSLSTFQTGMARSLDIQGSQDHGDSPRTWCPISFSLKHAGTRLGLWHSTVPFAVLEQHPKTTKHSHHGSQDCEVLNFLWCLSSSREEEFRLSMVWGCQMLAALWVVEGAECPAANWM